MAPALPEGFRLIAFESVGSTNDEAKRFAAAGAADGLVVTAGEQMLGRGRLGRAWASPPGNLYASFVFRPNLPLARAGELGFVVALAVHDMLVRVAPSVTFRCKWPNDLLANGRKIAGLLAEATARPKGETDFVVIGCGINLAHHPAESRWPATSLAALGVAASPDVAVGALAVSLAARRRLWATAGFEPIREAWLTRSFPRGEPLKLNLGTREVAGRFAGLDSHGALLLDLADGRREAISYGEVTGVDVS